jgi:nickel-dependent lactate racemase
MEGGALKHMKSNISLALGRRKIKISLDRAVLSGVQSKNKPLPNSPENALSSPYESPSLREMLRYVKDITVVVPDATRSWEQVPLMAQAIRREIRSGGRFPVTWVIGGGQHRLPTREETEMLLEDIPLAGDVVSPHDSLKGIDTGEKTSRGTPVILHEAVAQADSLILLGGIVHHDLAGFSGGRKSLLPGVSDGISIQHNHSLCLEGETFASGVECGRLEGNPVAEDMAEYEELVLRTRKGFLLNVIPDSSGSPYCYIAGHPIRAWRYGTEIASLLQTLWIQESVPLVLVSCGGYPYDIDLYQATKSISAVLQALAPGGGILLCAGLEDGAGPGTFAQSLALAMEAPELAMSELSKNFTIPAFIASKVVFDLKGHPAALMTEKPGLPFLGETFLNSAEAISWLNKYIPKGPALCVEAGNCVVVKKNIKGDGL